MGCQKNGRIGPQIHHQKGRSWDYGVMEEGGSPEFLAIMLHRLSPLLNFRPTNFPTYCNIEPVRQLFIFVLFEG